MRHAPAALSAIATSSIIALNSIGLTGCDGSTAKPPEIIEVKIGGKTFRCKPALDEATRERGLGGVASLGPDEGMLFAFTGSDERNFWMRDCLMDLDIAYLDALGFVTAVHTMPKEPPRAPGEEEGDYYARLPRYPSVGRAQYALEVAPGTLAPLGVRRGSRAEFDREALKPFAK